MLEKRNVPDGSMTARGVNPATDDRSDTSIAVRSGGRETVEPSKRIEPEIFVPGTRCSNRSVWSKPSTATSLTFHRMSPAVGGAPRCGEPDRATIVYSPGATPRIENAAPDIVARGIAIAPDDINTSATDDCSRRRGYSATLAGDTGRPLPSTSDPVRRDIGTIRSEMSTPPRSSPVLTLTRAAAAASVVPG